MRNFISFYHSVNIVRINKSKRLTWIDNKVSYKCQKKFNPQNCRNEITRKAKEDESTTVRWNASKQASIQSIGCEVIYLRML